MDSFASTWDYYGLDGQLIEFEFGAYEVISENFIGDVYLGYGSFNGSTYSYYRGLIDLGYNRWFIQPSIGLKTDIIDLIFSLRTSHLRYNQVNYERPDTSSWYYYDDGFETYINNGDRYWFTQPALTFRLGYRYIKFQGQMGVSINLTERSLDYNPFHASIGLIFNFKPSNRGKGHPLFN